MVDRNNNVGDIIKIDIIVSELRGLEGQFKKDFITKAEYDKLMEKKNRLEKQLVAELMKDIKSILSINLYTFLTPLLREAYTNNKREIKTLKK